MLPPGLQTLSYNAIFMAILKTLKFNVPFTFFIMSSLAIIPRHITEQQFSRITTIGGKLIHQITFFSYDPTKLKRYINRLAILRHRVNMVKKPMFYSFEYNVAYPFLQNLRDVASNFASEIPCSVMNVVLPQIAHVIELKFEKITWGNEMPIPIHKTVSNILINFPLNYDFPSYLPRLYQILRNARKQNIHQQPVFTDDQAAVVQRVSNNLALTYTYDCPNCSKPIYDYYNSVSQKHRKTDFISKSFKHKICSCTQCADVIHSYRPLPKHDHTY